MHFGWLIRSTISIGYVREIIKSECPLTVNENKTCGWMRHMGVLLSPLTISDTLFTPNLFHLSSFSSVLRLSAPCQEIWRDVRQRKSSPFFPKVVPRADKIDFLQFFPFPFATSRQSCGCPRDVLHMHTGPEGVAVPFCRQGGGTRRRNMSCLMCRQIEKGRPRQIRVITSIFLVGKSVRIDNQVTKCPIGL